MKKLILFFAIGLLLSGCSLFKDSHEMEQNAEELVSQGSSAFVSGNYKTAVKAYTDLKDWYPFSKYAILAKFFKRSLDFTNQLFAYFFYTV